MTATKPIRQIICEAIAQITLNLEDCIQTEGGQVLRAFFFLIQEAANAQIKEKRDVVTNKLTGDIIDLLEYKRRMDSKNIFKNYVNNLSTKFVDNIKCAGISQETATRVQEIFEEFIANEIPDIDVISLVAELRDQAHPRPLSPKSLYRGFDVDGDPESFLKENYSNELSEGIVFAASLRKADPKLARALENKAHRSGRTIDEILPRKIDILARRREMFAEILQIEESEVFNFLRTTNQRRKELAR